MTATWTLGMLPAWSENIVPLDAGEEPTATTAQTAAWAALVTAVIAAGDDGRQEYRLTVAGALAIVTPGLTVDGAVDIEELRHAIYAWPLPGGVP